MKKLTPPKTSPKVTSKRLEQKAAPKNKTTKTESIVSDSTNYGVVKKSTLGQRIGYVRVSTLDQNPDRQLDSLPEHLAIDRLFTDTASGKDMSRPQLEAMLDFVREGDTVVVHSMDRLARNLDDLRQLVQSLTQRGVRIEFLKENLSFTGEDSPMANLLLSVMGAFAEFERALIRERQREGIALAKKRGAYKGRKKVLSREQVEGLQERLAEGISKAQLARELGISRETLYQYLRTLS
jgi:DNA invertase Pin-like site-specific DNA recombinase